MAALESDLKLNTVHPQDVFVAFSRCEGEQKMLICDLRQTKHFKKSHIAGAFSIAVSRTTRELVDYSHNQYKDFLWSKDCHWARDLVLYGYGEEPLDADHPVVAYLLRERRAASLRAIRGGLEAFEKAYPFLVTPSLKGMVRSYPGELIPKLLYLGDWDHASDPEVRKHLKIKHVITIHNNPENLEPGGARHERYTLADVESEDVAQFFEPSFRVIEEAREKRQRVIVHCGAGVSRSASLCIAYLMRARGMPARQALEHCQQRRSVVQPNQGFWKQLLALEKDLGMESSGALEAKDTAAVAAGKAAALANVELGLADYGDDNDDDGGGGGGSGGAQATQEDLHELEVRAAREAGSRGWGGEPAGRAHAGSGGGGASPGGARLAVYKGGEVVDNVPLDRDRLTLGRGKEATVVLDHQSVSRLHAELSWAPRGAVLRDLHSSHGTFLDGRRLGKGEMVEVRDGMEVRFGASTRRYVVKGTGGGLEGGGSRWAKGGRDNLGRGRSEWEEDEGSHKRRRY